MELFFMQICKLKSISWAGKIKTLTTMHRMIIDIGEVFSD